MKNVLVSYAQNREDLLLWVLLNQVKNGFYVDIGANDPTLDSVTKFFYDKGWRGINIEPIPAVYERLQTHRPEDINLNIGIANKTGELTIREYSDGWHGWSTLSSETKQAHPGKKYRDYQVPVAPLRQIFEQHKVRRIDFLKVDVEGFEFEVLSSNDWHRYKPKVIVVEGHQNQWIELLKEHHYTVVHFDGLNTYFVRNDLTKTHTLNDYNRVLLGGQTVVSNREYALQKQFVLANKIIDSLYKKEAALQTQNDVLTAKWQQVQQHPETVLGLRALVRAVLRRLLRKVKRTA